MKKILLVSNHVFHYRVRIYNYLFDAFKKQDYEFSIVTNGLQKSGSSPDFKVDTIKSGFVSYLKYIKQNNPDYVIVFLHLKNIRQFFITYYCRLRGIPIIYWNHGINLKTPNAHLKNLMYYHLHNLSNAIILYSENEKKYIKNKNQHKIFIANNTLNLEDLSYERDIEKDKNFVKEKYNLESENNILFVGRITKNKEIEVLLSSFRNTKAEVVLVGPGLNENLRKVVDDTPNYHYLGAIYDREDLSALFNTSKLFCIPGNLGLALIEALYWGKPTITLAGANTPEIIYLKDGKNGYIVKNKEMLEKKALDLLTNKNLYHTFSKNARDTFIKEAHISKMFQGFRDAVGFCTQT